MLLTRLSSALSKLALNDSHRVVVTQAASFMTTPVCHKTSFFNRNPASPLWDSAAPPPSMRSRGKRSKPRKRIDLSRGHEIGEGNAGMQWPGLNSTVKGNIEKRSEEEQLQFLQDIEEKMKLRERPPREAVKGWSGGKWGGVHCGPLEPIDGLSFDDFDSVILNVQRVSHMRASGRNYSVRATVAVGNNNGVVGINAATASDIGSAVRKARVKAAKRLMVFDRFEERTVFEDVLCNHHATYMYIRQQPIGYGIRAHRAVKEIALLLGIKDLYVKVFGSTTMLNLTKCFIKGLELQESHQKKSDRSGYNVVRMDELNGNFPQVLASPSSGVVKTEPFDAMNSYLEQDIVVREYQNIEGLRSTTWSHLMKTNNRGIPVPPNFDMPDSLVNIRDYRF